MAAVQQRDGALCRGRSVKRLHGLPGEQRYLSISARHLAAAQLDPRQFYELY
jgi:hypothetical protein